MNFPVRLAAIALLALPAIAEAQSANVPGVAPATEQPEQAVPGVAPASSPTERRLTPQQVDQVLAETARRNHEMPVGHAALADEHACPTKPHGEMGMEAGTGGYGAIYGAAVVPLGCRAAVAIAIESGTSGGLHSRRGR